MRRLLAVLFVVYLPFVQLDKSAVVAPITGHYQVLGAGEWFQVICLVGQVQVDVVSGYVMVHCGP